LIIIAAFEAPGVVTGLDDGAIWALHKSYLDEMDRIEDPNHAQITMSMVLDGFAVFSDHASSASWPQSAHQRTIK
jgi:hypothetical protein